MPDASVLFACAGLLSTKEETRTLHALAPAWCRASWLTSREPHEVCPALISLLLVSQPGEAAPEEVLCRPPREAWPLARVLDALLMKMGRTACWLSHAVGRRQASLGTPVPVTLIVAPGPKACLDLASRRSQRASAERYGCNAPTPFHQVSASYSPSLPC